MKQNHETREAKSANCRQCGKRFKVVRFWQKFCSLSCKQLFHKNEDRAAREAWRAKARGPLDDVL